MGVFKNSNFFVSARTTAWTQDDYRDVIGRVESGTETEVEQRREQLPRHRADDCMDAGGRAAQEAKAENRNV
ncbi:MAG: hypothetical protein O7D86_09150 [Proteobacteria bacterium]|nr:hypothetical protein [Pseudomonadota bacterium]